MLLAIAQVAKQWQHEGLEIRDGHVAMKSQF
jgi:hypothetical protein